jgi:hypothetical protein
LNVSLRFSFQGPKLPCRSGERSLVRRFGSAGSRSADSSHRFATVNFFLEAFTGFWQCFPALWRTTPERLSPTRGGTNIAARLVAVPAAAGENR